MEAGPDQRRRRGHPSQDHEERDQGPCPEQVKVYFEGIKSHRLEAMFVLAITTGLRQGELFGLRWEDIDTKEGLLHVVTAGCIDTDLPAGRRCCG